MLDLLKQLFSLLVWVLMNTLLIGVIISVAHNLIFLHFKNQYIKKIRVLIDKVGIK
jgi:hypothetical protein